MTLMDLNVRLAKLEAEFVAELHKLALDAARAVAAEEKRVESLFIHLEDGFKAEVDHVRGVILAGGQRVEDALHLKQIIEAFRKMPGVAGAVKADAKEAVAEAKADVAHADAAYQAAEDSLEQAPKDLAAGAARIDEDVEKL